LEANDVKKGLLGWFASNHVAANLLMFLIIAAGLMSLFDTKKEIFPETSLDTISITVPYLGASPEDVEKGVLLRVEEAIAGIDGIKRITSIASEGFGTTIVEAEEYADIQDVLDDVKAEIDRIITFPQETEEPEISEVKSRRHVISIVVYGDASEKTLKTLADQIRDDLTSFENITLVNVLGIRPYEISIEVSEETLRKYSLTFDQVAKAVKQSSLDIPAGSVKTTGGTILLRTKGQMYYGPEFEDIIVLTRNDGTKIRLGDIAVVKDDFEDTDLYSQFDGKRAALVNVLRTGEQSALEVADTVKKYIENKRPNLPEGVSIAIWEDDSAILVSRINLLKRNAYLGLTLVFICLTLFLNFRLAFWTTMGIPISFLGAFYLIPLFGVSINMISLFAFIMSLGIVVDDAIVVGENIFAYRQQGYDRARAAVMGVREMSMPVLLAVLTTMFAFIPLAYTSGIMGKILRVLPIVVVSVLGVSLLEALLILPSHLSSKHSFKKLFIVKYTDKLNVWTGRNLEKFINGRFAASVQNAVRWRYLTVSTALAIFICVIGFIVGGYIKFTFFDPVEGDKIVATLTMPQGTPVEQTQEVIDKIEAAAFQLRDEYDSNRKSELSIFKHVSTTIGSHPVESQKGPGGTDASGGSESHLGEINIELLEGEVRDVSSMELMKRWRQIVGEVPGVSSLKFISEIFAAGEAINVELSHEDFGKLLAASEQLKTELRNYQGVTDISDSFEPGKTELKLALKDAGRTLGLTLLDLASQVRQGFYGEEAQRIQRGRDDIRVMVRYPKNERRSLSNVENMRIRLSDGTEVPFRTVAEVKYGQGYATIKRVDRRRVVNVTADAEDETKEQINNDIYGNVLPVLKTQYPGLQCRFAGEQRERNESLGSLRVNFVIALMAIYALLAVQFKSYAQPLIVMSAIPFGIVGATIGHVVMGYNLSILSMFGIVALSGVVVNDSLIIIDLINRERSGGVELHQVIRDCATRRFRPIMLTTLTTFFGLVPMMLERSLQARFLIPMAISLAFGVMFATMITLFLVPSLYMILEDFKGRFLPK